MIHRILNGLILAFASAAPLAAQGVVVAPHAVYMDHRTRSGSITLYNPNAEPAEVTISSFFGYPVTDSAGAFLLVQPDSVTAAFRCLDDVTKADSAIDTRATWSVDAGTPAATEA